MSGAVQRVLIAAENASTRLGGEAILPHHIFRLLRQRGVDPLGVVHARCRGDLEACTQSEPERVHFVPDQALQKLFHRLSRCVPRRIGEATFGLANQLLTQAAQRKVLRRLVTPGTVVHQPIPVAPRFPSLLYGLGAPVVLGPLNGGMEYPPALRGRESLLSRTFIRFARLLSDAANTVFPGKRNAAVVLVANQRTRSALPRGLRGQVIELVENGVDVALWHSDGTQQPEPGRFVFVGRMVDWKALDLVIEALREVPGASLDAIGDGPMRADWQSLARAHGVAERVRFLGWLSQAECARHLATCCALVLPSLFECGGAVVLEAMAMARPVIATAWGGPLDYLDETCGILIPPTSREAIVEGFAAAMVRLMKFPEAAHGMGVAGRQKLLRDFDWNVKIERVLETYELARSGAATR
jgi:glycosyltransferase involved in cell wall biosynthesis